MKMFYNGTPIKSLNIKHYEVSTNDCTAIPSDLQSGVTCVAKGKKITGTGKSFSFASYGRWTTNISNFIPMDINTIQIGSMDYPVRMTVSINDSHSCDFSTPQEVAEVIVDGTAYPMTVSVQNGEFLVTCEKTISIQLFM
jgi:hypothetical protein